MDFWKLLLSPSLWDLSNSTSPLVIRPGDTGLQHLSTVYLLNFLGSAVTIGLV